MPWKIIDDLAVFQLDKSHQFQVERTEKGFKLKVFDFRTKKPSILFVRTISDVELGFSEVDVEG
jgi:hypothetical protein